MRRLFGAGGQQDAAGRVIGIVSGTLVISPKIKYTCLKEPACFCASVNIQRERIQL